MSGSKPCLPYSLTAEPKIEKGLMWGVVQGFKTLVKVSNLEIKAQSLIMTLLESVSYC